MYKLKVERMICIAQTANCAYSTISDEGKEVEAEEE
jgi:hypothetical protein